MNFCIFYSSLRSARAETVSDGFNWHSGRHQVVETQLCGTSFLHWTLKARRCWLSWLGPSVGANVLLQLSVINDPDV
jgi:hypothetical protein